MSSQVAGSFTFLTFLASKFQSGRLRKVVLCIIVSYLLSKLLKKLYRRRYDKVQYVSLARALSTRYDFIVVGSGTSGSCVAGLLARDHRRPKVLLIEAGDKDDYTPLSSEVIPALTRLNQKTHKDWQYYSTPQQNGCAAMNEKRSNWPRGKVMGGSSILNYMVYVRGNPEDYNEWSDIHGCKGWSWQELVPIFKSLEKCIFRVKSKEDIAVRGFNGLQTISRKSDEDQWKLSKLFVAAAQNVGFPYNDDYNGVKQDGVSYTQFNIDENGRRLSSYRAFVATLFTENPKAKYNIDILPNAQVTKILCKNAVSDNRKIVYGVQINNQRSQNIYIDEENGGEVIVSCGAVGSPHLLLLSGIGDAQQLKKHNIAVQANVPGVGLNLKDHIMQVYRVIFKNDKLRNEPGIIYEGMSVLAQCKHLMQYLLNGRGPITGTGLDAHVFTQSRVAKKNGLKSNDLQLVQVLIGDEKNPVNAAKVAEKYMNYDVQSDDFSQWKFKNKTITEEHLQKSVMAISMNVRPQSTGRITLVSSDPHVHPNIDPNYLANKEDMDAFLEGMQILEQIYSAEPFKSMGAEIVEFERFRDKQEAAEYFLKNYTLTIYHPVGTCKMGNLAKDKYAVCSERLRVRGIKNLRVADAAIAPDLVAGNTQAMCYVIGCKAARMILEDWNHA